ncbi:BUD13 homolog isoform X3 [Neomonachus schauinslandi]|uniref:BUD13 homolog n=1 Tax=Neomonachus schauinslandi TaxID=29088 RepID=A0A8M1MX70_NEOSC|nr:BUD13 homolog isoform X3 [Neomonachus schauinslandi]
MAAAPPLSKAEYLKRYLSGAGAGVDGGPDSGRKRRRKRPKPGGAGGKGMRIVDDDVSWTSISTTKPEKEEEDDDGDLPVVAEFVDERPEEVKQMEAFRSSAKWKLLGGHSEDLPSHRHFRHDSPDSSPPRRVRHDTPDSSPPRRGRHDTPDSSPPRRVRHDTLDSSPPRRVRHDTPDSSPPRRVRHDTPDSSPRRRVRHDTPDSSPPRRVRHDTPDPSPPRRPHRHSSGVSSRKAHHNTPDPSLPRRAHHNSSNSSVPRRARNSSPDTSQPRRTLDSLDTSQLRRARHDSPDLAANVPHSLPRTKSSKAPERASSKISPHWKGPGPSHASLPKNSKYEYDSDLSPPRKKQAKSHKHDSKALVSRSDSWKASDSDLSPPRHKQSSGHKDSDSDLSPPRNRPTHRSSDSDLSPPRRKQRVKSSDSDLSPPRRSQPLGKKAAHMYSGAKTGLVLTDIQREQQELKKRDQEALAFEAEFQYAETVFRDKSGRKRNLKLERLEQRRKAEKDLERDELYAQWGKGLAQSRQQQQNVEDAVKEMQKPLARYIDDEDLDRMLREQEREGDPMANFIKKNKAKENKNKKVRPRYSGPAPPPNRFNIWPGYRWDGVDRSNGFEQKRFARLASKKAVEELAYKWSVEDM